MIMNNTFWRYSRSFCALLLLVTLTACSSSRMAQRLDREEVYTPPQYSQPQQDYVQPYLPEPVLPPVYRQPQRQAYQQPQRQPIRQESIYDRRQGALPVERLSTLDQQFEQAAQQRSAPQRQQPAQPQQQSTRQPSSRSERAVPTVQDNAADPYQDIPDEEPTRERSSTNRHASPAVMALLIKARSDLAKGKQEAAISRLERALRIDSGDPKIWNALAKAHYSKGSYKQAIVMAEKSNALTQSGKALADDNWQIIRRAATKSGNVAALRKALQYQAR